MSITSKMRSIASTILACVLACVLCIPIEASAGTRTTDIVRGTESSQLGLTASALPGVSADYVYCANGSGEEYFNRAASEQVKIASVTKIMTALVTLDRIDQNIDVYVSHDAAMIGESTADLQAGDVLSLTDALKALMLPSSNDAAQSIAESVGAIILNEQIQAAEAEQAANGGGNGSDAPSTVDELKNKTPYSAFIEAMNAKATQLGMTNSVFTNPHGLDGGIYGNEMHSTAYDVYLMAKAAMGYELFRSIVSTEKAFITVKRKNSKGKVKRKKILLESTDALLGAYPGACGIKTGYTDVAGACMAGACEMNGSILYSIVLHAPDSETRFSDCMLLWNWVKNNTVDYRLINSTETIHATIDGKEGEYPVVAQLANSSWIDTTFKATVANPESTVQIFALDGNVSQELQANNVGGDVHVGQRVGTLVFKQHNETVGSIELLAAEECPGPDFFEGVGIFWDRAIRGITGQPTQAEDTLINAVPLLQAA